MRLLKWIFVLSFVYVVSLMALYFGQELNLANNKMVKGSLTAVADLVVEVSDNVSDRVAALQKKRKGLDKIQVPNIKGRMPNGYSIDHQWDMGGHRFVYIGFDKVPAYAQPRLDALVVNELPASTRVRVVYLDPDLVKYQGKTTKWVFLTTPDGQTPVGWVLNSQLGYKNQFRKLGAWEWDTFEFCKGQYCASYSVSFSGAYESKWGAQGGQLYLQGQDKGHMMSFGSLFWAKKNSPDDFQDVFYQTPSGELKQEVLFEKEGLRIITL